MSDDSSDAAAPEARAATATTIDVRGGRRSVDDPTRTSAEGRASTPEPSRAREDRLPAPLQYRDPQRYEIVGEHGRGGLGRVLRARDRELGRDVAVKELLHRGNTSELRFFREALITARLEHPGIVPVHEAGRWPDGTPFYAMKLVQGRPLREVIDECKTLQDRLALLPHVIAVADAISYAHDRRIIHRDLKPSNVIVGEFGETVVIDWGLAKDLKSEVPDPIDDGPYRTPANDGLTAAGSVLGTPAYMAPEQREGQADERSDIYALGGILFSLVTGEVPGSDGATQVDHHRGRLAAHRIPRDLSAIIARCLSANPSSRYLSAQALSGDLRRYTQRRPISARRYSLGGRLLLGFARHRVATAILICSLCILSAFLALDAWRVHQQREATEQALDELTLKHAELLLDSDPSAALDALAQYNGTSDDVAERLRAEANGRGVALMRATPHSDTITWLHGSSDGTVTSLSNDGSVVATSPDGKTRLITRGAASKFVHAYCDRLGLLVYACDPADVCLVDVGKSRRIPSPTSFVGVAPDAIAMSEDCSRMAVLSRRGDASIWDVTNLNDPKRVYTADAHGGYAVQFVNSATVAIATKAGVEWAGASSSESPVPIDDPRAWDIDRPHGLLAVANSHGRAIIIDDKGQRIIDANLCGSSVNGLSFFDGGTQLGYACQEGTFGTWSVSSGKLMVRGHVSGAANVAAASFDGSYFAVGSSSGELAIYDSVTNLVRSYVGHGVPLTAVAVPSSGFPSLLSGDTHGRLRVWPTPSRVARSLANIDTPLFDASFLDNKSLVAVGHTPFVYYVGLAGGLDSIGPHETANSVLIHGRHSDRFATYGAGAIVEVWSTKHGSPPQRVTSIDTGRQGVAQVFFAGPTDEGIATAGTDGALTIWTPSGPPRLLAKLDEPIRGVVRVERDKSFVMKTGSGALWRVTDEGVLRLLRPGGSYVSMLQSSPNDRWVASGDASGDVRIFDTRNWQSTKILKASGGIRHIVFSPDSARIAVASKDGMVHVAASIGGDGTFGSVIWKEFPAHATYLAFTAHADLLISACADGTAWFYAPERERWVYVPTGVADLMIVRTSPDDRVAATVDSNGRLIRFDLDAVRDSLVASTFKW